MESRVFNRRPMCTYAIAVVLGILSARLFNDTPHILSGCLVFICTAFIFFVFRFTKKRSYRPLSLIFVFIFALLLGLWAYPALPNEGEYTIEGRVSETPEYDGDVCLLTLDELKLNGTSIDTRIKLSVYEAGSAYGDYISVHGRVVIPDDSDEFPERHYNLSKGIGLLGFADSRIEKKGYRGDLYGWLLSIKNRLIDNANKLFGENGPAIAGMLFGETNNISKSDINAYRDSGVAHLFAVSGLHVSIIAGTLLLVLKRVNPWIKLSVIGVILLVYCWITAFAASLVRAMVMTMCVLAAEPLERRYDMASSMSLALMLILFSNPFALYTASLLISFAAVFTISTLTPLLSRLFKGVHSVISSAISVSIAGSVGMAPLSTYFFGRLPTLGVFANFIVIPLVPIIIIPSLVAVLLCAISPQVGAVVAFVPKNVIVFVNGYLFRIANIAFAAVDTNSPSIIACISMYIPMLTASDYCLLDKKKKLRLTLITAVAALVLIIIT